MWRQRFHQRERGLHAHHPAAHRRRLGSHPAAGVGTVASPASAATVGSYVALEATPTPPGRSSRPSGSTRWAAGGPPRTTRRCWPRRCTPGKFTDVRGCAGADTTNMTRPQGAPFNGTNPPQLGALRIDTELVTLGIGGNDYGIFGSLTSTCPACGRATRRATLRALQRLGHLGDRQHRPAGRGGARRDPRAFAEGAVLGGRLPADRAGQGLLPGRAALRRRRLRVAEQRRGEAEPDAGRRRGRGRARRRSSARSARPAATTRARAAARRGSTGRTRTSSRRRPTTRSKAGMAGVAAVVSQGAALTNSSTIQANSPSGSSAGAPCPASISRRARPGSRRPAPAAGPP